MDELTQHIKSRIQKLKDLNKDGVETFAGAFEKAHLSADVLKEFDGLSKEDLESREIEVSVAGRAITPRKFGKAAFVHIQDSAGRIQAYLKKDILGDVFPIAKKLDEGDIIGVRGVLFRTDTDELTIEVREFKLLTKSLRPLPEKWHGLKDVELRYRRRYVDLIVNPDVKDTFRKRSAIIKAIRDFLETRGFIEVETPMMQAIPGGAAAKPFMTHHNALDTDLYLRIAPELYLKRLLVGGFEKVYELNRNFRNEGVSTKHNPEFTMLEFYIAYKDYQFLMDFTEELIPDIAERALGTKVLEYGDLEIDLTPPWPRIPFKKSLLDAGVPEEVTSGKGAAFAWAKDKGIAVSEGMTYGKLLDEIFSDLVEPKLIQPTFITDYPVELSPLAKRKPEEPELVERFELFMAGREIANAFSELNDPMDQRERFEEQVKAKEAGDDESHDMDVDYIHALEYGMPPAAGEGIGIDRLVMLLTNSQSIRDVLLFPQMRPDKTYVSMVKDALNDLAMEHDKFFYTAQPKIINTSLILDFHITYNGNSYLIEAKSLKVGRIQADIIEKYAQVSVTTNSELILLSDSKLSKEAKKLLDPDSDDNQSKLNYIFAKDVNEIRTELFKYLSR